MNEPNSVSDGRESVKKAIEFINSKNYSIVYMDTDSIIFETNRKSGTIHEKQYNDMLEMQTKTN